MKVYGSQICGDCRNYRSLQKKRGFEAEYIEITENTENMKEFLRLRDRESVFDAVKEKGGIGIPFFVHEDGRMTLDLDEALSWIGQAPAGEEEPVTEFEIRSIRPGEEEEAAEAEQICFPPNEAAKKEIVCRRAALFPDLFLVAVNRTTGEIAGYLNGLAADSEELTDDFFTHPELHNPEGQTVMVLSIGVLPPFRRQGLAGKMMAEYQKRAREKGRKMLVLTCLEEKVDMYQKMGFQDQGMSGSCWGGEKWHQMNWKTEG